MHPSATDEGKPNESDNGSKPLPVQTNEMAGSSDLGGTINTNSGDLAKLDENETNAPTHTRCTYFLLICAHS